MTNVIVIQGRVVAPPELKQTSSGFSVCDFSIAHTRNHKMKEETEYAVDYFDVKAWGSNAEFAYRYLTKGTNVTITGRLETRTWEMRDGTKRKVWEIRASEMSLGAKRSDGSQQGEGGAFSPPQFMQADSAPDVDFEDVPNDSDLPF